MRLPASKANAPSIHTYWGLTGTLALSSNPTSPTVPVSIIAYLSFPSSQFPRVSLAPKTQSGDGLIACLGRCL